MSRSTLIHQHWKKIKKFDILLVKDYMFMVNLKAVFIPSRFIKKRGLERNKWLRLF